MSPDGGRYLRPMRAALCLLLAGSAGAQPADWSTLAPAVGVSVPGGGFGEAWDAGPALRVRVEAPAYGGQARAEVLRAGYASADPAAPAFDLTMPTVGWGLSLAASRARLGAGARVGVARFVFDVAEGAHRSETEAAVGVWAGAALRVAGPVEVWAEADVTRVSLVEPATIASVGGGLAVRLGTPGWLRGVLR